MSASPSSQDRSPTGGVESDGQGSAGSAFSPLYTMWRERYDREVWREEQEARIWAATIRMMCPEPFDWGAWWSRVTRRFRGATA